MRRISIGAGLCVALAIGCTAHAAPTGHQLFIGPQFEGSAPAAIPYAPALIETSSSAFFVTVYLNRADDAGADHPPAASFDLVWDPAVLTGPSPPGGVQTAPLLQDWYDKQLTVNYGQVGSGRLSISVSGGVTFDPEDFEAFSTEITTYDNQLPLIGPESGADQQNPFPLVTIRFQFVNSGQGTAPLAFDGAILSDQEGFALPNQGALDTVIALDDSFPPPPPGSPAASLPGLALLAAALFRAASRRA